MERKIHNLIQGSDEWHAFRLEHDGASEAAAMLGLSKKKTRSELLRMKHTGIAKEFSDWVQANVLDYGHEVEAMARPLIEEIIGDELYPATYSYGRLSASCDGLTMAGDTAFEHKQWNAELAAAVKRCELPDEYQPQCQQVMHVTGAERLIFAVSDGTVDNLVWMEVLPDAAWVKRIEAGWAQFHRDLETYVPPEVIPAAVAAPIQDLPALAIEITGSVVASNLVQWKAIVAHRVAAINSDLQTDKDFADAANMVKFLDDGEKRIDLVKSQAQSQATSIDEVFRALDDIKASMKAKRLELDKLVERRKTAIREEVVASGRKQFAEHIAALNTDLGKPYMPQIAADFAAAIKGKRTVASLRDAADTLLSQKKIEADMVAAKIAVNLESLRTLAADHAFLFSDTAQLVLKDSDACEAIIKSRIAEHQAAEEKRLAAEREKIRVEEEERANAAAAAKLKAEQEEAERLASEQRNREQAEAVQRALAAEPATNTTATASQGIGDDGTTETPAPGTRETVPGPTLAQVLHAAAPAEIAQVIAPADTGATMKLGDISSLLGFTVTADFLAVLGFQPARTEKAARLYPQRDFPAICAAIARHVNAVAATAMQKAA